MITMSSFEDGLKAGEWNPTKADNGWFLPLNEVAPTLAGAIRENSKDKGDAVDRPGLTLMIFARDGMLKFSLSSQEWPRTYYGTISDPRDLQASVEMALKANEGEWSVKKENRGSKRSF